jgi:chorismate mutase/prephenate dehydratase
MKLDDIRKRINETDGKLLPLLLERMGLSLMVGESKRESGGAVYNGEREKEILNRISDEAGEFGCEASALMQSIMNVSRTLQYGYLLDKIDYKLMKDVEAAKSKFEPKSVAYAGKGGSYGEAAAKEMFPESELRGYPDFKEAAAAVASGETECAVLPLENTTAGTVNEVYDLIPSYKLFIVKSINYMIRHNLLLTPGAEIQDIKTVISHPQALSQCSRFITRGGYRALERENTAYAAEEAAKLGDKSIAAIGSALSGKLYGLNVSDIDINNESCNQTRFVALANKLIVEEGAGKVSIAFRLPHRSGSLSSVLFTFASLNINLTKIQSRPIGDRPWEYIFYVDFLYEDKKKAYQALYQLESELPEVLLLGWY